MGHPPDENDMTRAPHAATIPRKAAVRVAEALSDTRCVLVVGPRQAGKTTLVRGFSGAERPYLTLDDPATLAAARADPLAFVAGIDRAVIDEIQRAPELMLAIKQSVDRDPRPGRFLLTGSANVMALPRVGDSLAGRVALITLLPLARAEIEGTAGDLVERLFSDGVPRHAGEPVTGSALAELVLAGGYPEALRREDGRRRVWHEDYLDLVLDRDARDVAAIEQMRALPRLMRMLAEQVGQLVVYQPLASALGLSVPTVQRYVAVLERLFLVRAIPAWSSNRLTRLVKTPKLHVLDAGLAATLRGTRAPGIGEDRTAYGPVLEAFAATEILKSLAWSNARASLSHFRSKDGDEVDLVLEDRSGRIVGIEIKAAATLRPKDMSGLRKLREAAGDRFARGILLHDHDRITPFAECIHAAPISWLWRG
jgi:hypothetical protein